MPYIWVTFGLLLCGCLELLLGINGHVVPLLWLGLFYYSVFRTWPYALVCGLIIGSILELGFGRGIPLALVGMPLVVILGQLWQSLGLTAGAARQLVPGAVVGCLQGGLVCLMRLGQCGVMEGSIRLMAGCLLWGVCVFPLLYMFFDGIAIKLMLRRFARAATDHMYEHPLWIGDEGKDDAFLD